ncbi:hypothetical protein BB560_000280 [Smittium megazygosporum]|uniref:Uncharacterized protein n=1 Tax=Smittium megazygosporum TaxID=133381 RepID=A0A2T9ZKV8_9FUNG|nr:hypothetical protein BB560_000280 [Smittium megazygosporum]
MSMDKTRFLDSPRLGELSVFQYLLERSISKNATDDQVIMTCANSHLEIVKPLARFDADLKTHEKEVLSSACKNGYLDVLKCLLDSCLDTHADNGVALISTIKSGNMELIKFLVDNGFDLHMDNDEALVCAIETNRIGAIRYLLDQGLKLDLSDEYLMENVPKHAQFGIIKTLIDLGIDINCKNGFSLKIVTKLNKLDFMKYLKKKGADLSVYKNVAFVMPNTDTLNFLVESGANLNTSCEDSLLLKLIILKGKSNSLKKYRYIFLFNEYPYPDGIMQLLLGNGNNQAVDLLLKHSADPHTDADAAIKFVQIFRSAATLDLFAADPIAAKPDVFTIGSTSKRDHSDSGDKAAMIYPVKHHTMSYAGAAKGRPAAQSSNLFNYYSTSNSKNYQKK